MYDDDADDANIMSTKTDARSWNTAQLPSEMRVGSKESDEDRKTACLSDTGCGIARQEYGSGASSPFEFMSSQWWTSCHGCVYEGGNIIPGSCWTMEQIVTYMC
jgi:hypothetical protein